MPDKFVYWFKEIDKNSLSIAGGKGANLGEMTKAGFPVPEGFCVGTNAYYKFVYASGLDALIKQKLDGLDVEDTQALQEASEVLKNAVLGAPVPEEVRQQIMDAYTHLSDQTPDEHGIHTIGNEVFVAVRSSATAEDLPSISCEEPVLVTIDGSTEFLKMQELWRKCEQNPNAKICVPALDGNKIVWKEVKEIYAHPAKTTLVKITTKTGREITVTPDHSFIVLDPDTMQAKPAGIKDISKETRVPVLKRLPLPEAKSGEFLDVASALYCEVIADERGLRLKEGKWWIQKSFPQKIPLTEDFAYFLGVFAAEGSTSEKNCVDISCESAEIAARIKNFVESLGLSASGEPKNVRTFSRPLVRLLHNLFGRPLEIKGKGSGARTKTVPSLVFNFPQKLIGAYLRGYFDGDGYVSNHEIQVASVSKSLRAGTALLLSLLGIKCYIRDLEVSIPASQAKAFYELVGCTEERKKEKVEKLISDYDLREKHHDQLETFPASKRISEIITREESRELPYTVVETLACLACTLPMKKHGRSSSGKQRWECDSCKAWFSEGTFHARTTSYVTSSIPDSRGRFMAGFSPWNKRKFEATERGTVALQKIAEKLNSAELKEILSADVIWDRIEKIEEVEYEGLVYDFVVPGPQNFLAGFGGIITHNTASFAGEQATFLNVRGAGGVVDAVRKCWASLFEARAIYYRHENNFDHLKVGLCAVVQRMVQSEVSGVMFTVDPFTQERNNLVIEACIGLGEAIVSGMITPDHYVVDKAGNSLMQKQARKQTKMIVRAAGGEDETLDVPEELAEAQKLPDAKILELAAIGKAIEDHYGSPQDIEWALEKGKLYIVQSRAITTLGKGKKEAEQQAKTVPEEGREPQGEQTEMITEQRQPASEASVLLQGQGASPGVASGPVRIVLDIKELYKIKKGDVLVTRMTTPDFVPAMKRARAIVTDEGGATCHAAIVSRELGVPCIVGTMHATSVLREDQVITVDAKRGVVYDGKAELEEEKTHAEQVAEHVTAAAPIITGTKIYVNMAEVDLAEKVAGQAVDGVGLLRAEFMIAGIGVHPRKLIKEGRQGEFVDAIAKGLRKVCGAFYPRPVIYRATDFKTNEYKNLEGGAEFEPHEENPMIGYRGCFRYIKEPDEFMLELEAIKKVREKYGMKNLHLMIPFVRTVREFVLVKELVEKSGLHASRDFKLGIMCEIPSTVILAEEFCKAGAQFFSIGSNDLTQLTLGIDRDNSIVAEEFDERDEAIYRSLEHVIKTCHKYNVTVGICGQAPSVYPEFAEKLVEFGIDSISCNPDVIDVTRRIVASAEQRVLLEKTRKT